MILKNILYCSLIIGVFLLIYFSTLEGIEIKQRRYIADFIKNLNKTAKKRLKSKKVRKIYTGESEDQKFIDKVDDLLSKACIRSIVPFMTSELYVALTILLAILVGGIFYSFYKIPVIAIGISMSCVLFSIMIMKLLSRLTYERIDDQVLAYINILENLSESNEDIVTIFDKSIPYLKEPLKEYSDQFVFECRKGIPIEKAFNNYAEKIESKKLNQLIRNLEMCSKYEANYKKILGESRMIMRRYFEQKAKRAQAIRKGRIDIAMTILLNIVIIYLTSGINPTLGDSLLHTFEGNVILGYYIVVILAGIYKILTLDKMNS